MGAHTRHWEEKREAWKRATALCSGSMFRFALGVGWSDTVG
jgi:hypothetical protein